MNPELVRRAVRISKFGTVGLSGVVVNAGLLFLLTEKLKIDYKISALISIELSIANNFCWNTLWTWSDKKINGQKKVFARFIKFQISSLFSAYVVNYSILIGLTELAHFPYYLSNIIGIVFGSFLNFIFGHFWVFRRGQEQVTISQ
jgi:dolichol-phosphate mannosyltransferase